MDYVTGGSVLKVDWEVRMGSGDICLHGYVLGASVQKVSG